MNSWAIHVASWSTSAELMGSPWGIMVSYGTSSELASLAAALVVAWF
jgi:hypothetical protein